MALDATQIIVAGLGIIPTTAAVYFANRKQTKQTDKLNAKVDDNTSKIDEINTAVNHRESPEEPTLVRMVKTTQREVLTTKAMVVDLRNNTNRRLTTLEEKVGK